MKNVYPSNASYRWFHVLISTVMVLSLLAGCRLPWEPSADVTIDDTGIAESVPTQVPTKLPRKDLPPALVEVSPLPNSFIALNQPITLFFNQPMDTVSVEAAIHFEPRVSGRFTWEEDQIVTFLPDQSLSADSTLSLSVNTSAQAVNKKTLQDPIKLNFQTADHLRVTQIVPMDGTDDVSPERAIFVTFNQPVVAIGAEANTEPGFTLLPEVPGNGEWLNTSTFVFTPDHSMDGGITYTLHLNETLTATSGAGLAPSQDLLFSFTTMPPGVLNILPSTGERLNLDGPVEIHFNMRMDPESVEERFNLISPAGTRVPGSFAWDDDFKEVAFSPDRNLIRNTTYTVQLEQGAASSGGLPIDTATETLRTTFPGFSVNPALTPEFQSYYGEFGQYKINFTTPIDPAEFKDKVTILPDVHFENIFLSDADTSIVLTGYFDPETLYTLTIDATLGDVWDGSLGEDITYTFSTPPAKPSFSVGSGFFSHNLIFVPASVSELIIQATNINTVTLEISPITTGDLITLLHPDNYDYRQIFLPNDLETITQNLDLERNVNEVLSIPLTYEENPLTPGVYFLRLSSQDVIDEDAPNSQKFYLIVSENNLVMKNSPTQAFIWATRLGDYRPLDDVPVSVFNTEGTVVASGRTDADGLFMSDIERFEEPYTSFFTLVGEPGQEAFAFSISNWGQAYTLYEMGINLNTAPVLTDAYIYTDRPIYRPGDRVNFKAMLFTRENGIPVATDLDTVTVTILGDPGMSGIPMSLYSESLELSRFGTVEGFVTLEEDLPTGLYRIEISKDEQLLKVLYFDVAAYRKPEIELKIDLAPSEIIAGETLTASVQAEYYFGMPAADQPLSWTLFRDEVYFDLPGYRVGPMSTTWLLPRMSEVSPLGTIVMTGEGATNAQGQFNLDLTPRELAFDDASDTSLEQYHLEVTVIDESGFPVSYRDSALVHPETFYIGVQPEAFYGKAGSPFNFSILTVNWDKQAVSGLPLEATFETITWNVEQTLNPEMPYRYVAETELVASASPVTDAEGQARVAFTPEEPGTYLITLESGDAITEVVVWVAGAGSAAWPRQSQNLITLVPDATSYQPGQIAQIFFPNPFNKDAKALVTIERGRVMETQVLDIDGAGRTFSLPITQDSVPNVYVSVMLLGENENGDPDYRQGILNLSVIPISKVLNVELVLEPTVTEPGELVTATLKITDPQGNPVEGEFSIAVVDKAVLALVEPNSLPILEAFYGEQPLSVQTSFSLKTFATQLTLSSMDNGRGGGGDLMMEPILRESFPDTAFWRADVVTGANGTASLEIPMPDTLTTWAVEVRGLTKDYLVGHSEVEILTQKPLMIQPVTPRFLVDGDRVEMAAIVHNNTLGLLEVDVVLLGNGFTLDDDSIQSQRVAIEAGDHSRVTWWGTVDSVDAIDLVFQAASEGLADSSVPIWGDLQVLRYSMPYTFSTAGQLTEEGQRLELVSLPISTDPSSGEIYLELNPSLTGTLVEGLQALEKTPYNDTVSILSRLMANLNAYLALNALGVDSPQLQANLSALVDEGLQRLLEAQNFDGGWSWWAGTRINNQTSDPFITAYVMLGLDQASAAGLDVAGHFIDQGIDYLVNNLPQPEDIESPSKLDHLAFQVYALRNSGLSLSPYTEELYDRRSSLSPWSLAMFSLSLRAIEGTSSRVNTLLADLESMALRSATGVHWESDQTYWMLPGTPIFNTAVGVYALSQLDPASASLPLALRYLLTHRQSGGLWSSTFESAWVLMAITEAMQGTGDFQADFDFQATLNDTLITEGTAASTATFTSVTATTSIDSLYPDSPNTILIERGEGIGTLYYRVDLQAYQPAETAEAINRGISLQRDYYLAGKGCPGAEDCVSIDSLTLDPNDPSQIITVALTVNVSHDMYKFMLEDFIPAGTEVFNRGFLTSETLLEDPLPVFDHRSPFKDGWGWWYFNKPQIYDDHVLWSANYIPAGTYILTYEILPYQRGVYQVLPAHAWQYFYPEVQGTSSGDLFTIE